MNAISFFKPTIAKIIVAVLIFAMSVPFIHYDTGIKCIAAPCLEASTGGSIFVWLVSSYGSSIYWISYVSLIIGIIMSYLVACMIIFAINKIRK